MPHADLGLVTSPNGELDDLSASGAHLLLERGRLGMRLTQAGIVVVLIGWIVVSRGDRWQITVVQGVNFIALAAALRVLRDPARNAFNHLVCFGAYTFTIACTAAVGVLAGDATTPMAILVGLAVISGTVMPWSPWWQLLAVAVTTGAAIWTVTAVVVEPHLFWVRSVGAIAPTLAASVYMSYILRRQRAAVAQAARERWAREAGLRDANRRLEHEVQEHRRTEETLRFAMRELDHRVKNTLALVQSVAEQTLRSSASMGEFGDAFSGRLQSMASIHNALAQRRWEGLALADLVELVVGPYRQHPGSVSIACDGAFVVSELVRVLGMALHELATNSAKYGALSTAAGRVTITARVDGAPAARLRISWTERGGPATTEPARRGFGMRLIEDALAYEADGHVALRFPAEGLCCDIDILVPPRA